MCEKQEEKGVDCFEEISKYIFFPTEAEENNQYHSRFKDIPFKIKIRNPSSPPEFPALLRL